MRQPSLITNSAKVILISILAAITYGIVHDEITAHLCVEYFTLAHPPLFHTDSPAILGLCWGITATIGVGFVLGVLLAAASQSGASPRYPIPALYRSISALLGTMAFSAALAAFIGFELSRHSVIPFPSSFAYIIPLDRHDIFMAVWFAHSASYLVGFLGGAWLTLRIWKKRGKPHMISLLPRTPWAIVRFLLLVALVIGVIYIRFIHS